MTPQPASTSNPDHRSAVTTALAQARDQYGDTLLTLSQQSPVLVIFLRHFGCTFCREAAADIERDHAAIADGGVIPVFVHMSSNDYAEQFFKRYPGLAEVRHISDPKRTLYRALDLKRGTLGQVFGLKSWTRGFTAGVWNRHWVGMLAGDGFQMPGVFLLRNGRIAREYRHQSVADRPDYRALARA